MQLKIWYLAKKPLMLLFGVILVFFLQTSQTSDNQKKASGDSTEQSTDEDGSDNAFLVNIDWVSSLPSVQIQPILQWIRDIELPQNPVSHIYEIIETGTTQFFQTLFQRIISPNAP